MKYILGKKRGMSQIWKENRVVPVTLIEAGPATVTQVRTLEKDGYAAVQIGFGSAKRLSKAQKGHLKDLGNFRHLREFRVNAPQEGSDDLPSVGARIDVSMFEEGEKIMVSGITKGKGFQGVVKRHGFGGGPRSHGQKHGLRAPGSIGSQAPQRVIKGKKMAGHMGVDRVSVKNLTIVGIDVEKNLIMVKGAVPGNNGGLLEIVSN